VRHFSKEIWIFAQSGPGEGLTELRLSLNFIWFRVRGKFDMEAYAVIETGGKQYRVRANDRLQVDRLQAKEGEKIEIGPVLAISDGKDLELGKPEIKKATVAATVVEHIRGDKVISFKKKRRKGYSRKQGHRQELTVLKVESIPSLQGKA